MTDDLQDERARRVLLITCSDISLDPYALLAGGRSTVYILQNAGNVVEPSDPGVEGAIALYEVDEVILCGHSACGVLRHLYGGASHIPSPPPALLQPASPAVLPGGRLTGTPLVNSRDGDLAKMHLLAQFDNLIALPEVVGRCAAGALKLYCWLYENETDILLQYDPKTRSFSPKG